MSNSGPRVAVAGWIGSSNLGDELIFAAIQRMLLARGASCAALSIDPEQTTAVHGCDAMTHRGPRDAVRLYQDLNEVQGLVFGGGGLLQSETSPWNTPFHLSRIWTARSRKLPWVGVGLGVGEVRDRVARGLIHRTFRHAIGVTVRDPGSAETLRAMGVNDAVVTADPVLGTQLPDVLPGDYITVSLRRRNPRGRGTARRKAAQEVDSVWVDSVAAALDRVSAAAKLGVRFVAFQPDRDDPVHRVVASRMASEVSFADSSVENVLEETAAGRFVIAMRYHAAIGALLAGRPAVILDYSPKMRYLAADVGTGLQVCSADRIEGDTLLGALRRAEDGLGGLGAALARLRDRQAGNELVVDRLLESV